MLNLLKFFHKRFRFFLFITNILIVIIVILLYKKSPITKAIDDIKYEEDGLSCHYLKDEGALKALDDLVSFHPNAIFFIESSCQGLTSRQACSVESAATAHPDKQVNLLFTAPISWTTYKSSALSTLLTFNNVEAVRIHIADYAKGTPLYDLLRMNRLSRDDINTNLGEVLKYLTIYKYSGVYLNLDVIVARSFENLNNNWIVKESPASVSSEIFAFSDNQVGRSLAEMAINILLSDLSLPDRQDYWTFDNSQIMRQLVTLWCTTTEILDLRSSSCNDLEVHEPDLFFPIPQHDRHKYFQQGKWSPVQNETIFTFNTWGHLTKYYIVPKNSLYDKLAQKYCPAVFEFYGAHFGLY